MTTLPAIRLDEVTRTYATGDKPALDHVSVTIERGDYVAITGPSGSGKSTLLNILGLLDRPNAGTYTLMGRDTSTLSRRQADHARGHDVGFIFQSSHMLLEWDVHTNVELGLRCQHVSRLERATRADAALHAVGLDHKAATKAKLLSGGERQRAAVARAIATAPPVILADEPTGSLDLSNASAVLDLLEDAHRAGSTVIVVTHDMTVARRAARRLALESGHIVTDERSRPLQTAAVIEPDSPTTRSSPVADTLTDAVQDLHSRVLRTLMLIMAFALGVAGMICAHDVAETASVQVAGRLTAAALDQVNLYPDVPLSHQQDWDAAAAKAAALPHVASVGIRVIAQGSNARVKRQPGAAAGDVVVIGVTPSYLRQASARLAPATAANLFDHQPFPAAIVSTEAAKALDLPVGSQGIGPGATIQLNGTPLTVVGVFDPSDRAGEATRAVLVPMSEVVNLESSNGEIIVVTDMGYPAQVAAALPLALAPQAPGSIRTTTVADLQGLRIGVAEDMSALVALVGSIVLLVAAIGAAVTQFLTVEARTSEIALRRSLGATRRGISHIFLIEGALVGLIGGVLGSALAIGALLIVAVSRDWTPVVSAQAWWQGPALGAAAGLVSAVVPAQRASTKEPALAIRD